MAGSEARRESCSLAGARDPGKPARAVEPGRGARPSRARDCGNRYILAGRVNKLVLAALVALLAAGGAWLFFSARGGRGGAVPAPEGEPVEPGHDGAELAAPSGAVPEDVPRRQENRARVRVVEEESFELTRAEWLDVAVVLPPGLPPEDRTMLLAFARKDGEDYEEDEARELGEQLGLDDSFVRPLGREHHWSRRPLAARVRLPVPRGAAEAVLLLQSRYLHLDPVEVGLPEAKEISLEPELGGWVTGRCLFPGSPPAAEDIALEFDGR